MRHSYFPLGKQSICSSANKAGAGPLSIRVEASGWDELGNYTEPSANFFSSRLRKSRPIRPPSIASTSSACPIRTSRWHPKRQGGSLPLRPSSDSAAFAPASTTSLAGERRAAGITCASVVGVELHMHPDVGVCSSGYDDLIAISSAPPATRARGAAGAGLVEWTRWGTTPRGRLRSPRHVCGSPARYGRPREHRRPRCVRSVHRDDGELTEPVASPQHDTRELRVAGVSR